MNEDRQGITKLADNFQSKSYRKVSEGGQKWYEILKNKTTIL